MVAVVVVVLSIQAGKGSVCPSAVISSFLLQETDMTVQRSAFGISMSTMFVFKISRAGRSW